MGSSFPSDGSYLERFKQLQHESQLEVPKSSSSSVAPISIKPSKTSSKILSNSQESSPSPLRSSAKPSFPNGKLAFTLKQKSKLAVCAIKLGEDDDDDVDNEAGASRQAKKPKLESIPSILPPEDKASDTVPPPPTDPEVKKVADKLSLFVAKNGRQFENITREKNPGNSPFRFLFDTDCAEYKYYEYRVAQEEAALAPEAGGSAAPYTGSGSNAPRFQSSHSRQSSGGQNQRYQTPASALYSGGEDHRRPSYSSGSSQKPAQERLRTQPYANDPVAMMEFYMKKAAREDLRKPPRQSKDEMPPPASLQTSPSRQPRHSPVMWPPEEAPVQEAALPPYTVPNTGVVEDAASVAAKKGHHMGDYIPPEELEKFLAKCNDAKAAKAAKATADRAKIQADNVGHRLLSKMGWKEGEGLGSGRSGRADPVQAGQVKVNNLGVGAEQPGEVTADDDIYEQYKKRMMLGYKFRPNPLNNPRKAYY